MKIKKLFYSVGAALLVVISGIWMIGCESKVEKGGQNPLIEQPAMESGERGGTPQVESAPGEFMLAVQITGAGKGSVTSGSEGIDCIVGGGNCFKNYAAGTQVELTATADVGYHFLGWGGACTGNGNCVVNLTANTVVSASFEASVMPNLSVTVPPSPDPADPWAGRGYVTSDPTGIDCGKSPRTACSKGYFAASIVKLIATVDDVNSEFAGWDYGTCNTNPECVVTMPENGELNVKAVFKKKEAVLKIFTQPIGAGKGNVTSDPEGIDCGYKEVWIPVVARAGCEKAYPVGTSVILKPKPYPGSAMIPPSIYDHWEGPCIGASTCNPGADGTVVFTVDANPTMMTVYFKGF